jgi:hypothetical protein
MSTLELEDREGDCTIILRLISVTEIMKMGGGLNWLRFMSIGWFWY